MMMIDLSISLTYCCTQLTH